MRKIPYLEYPQLLFHTELWNAVRFPCMTRKDMWVPKFATSIQYSIESSSWETRQDKEIKHNHLERKKYHYLYLQVIGSYMLKITPIPPHTVKVNHQIQQTCSIQINTQNELHFYVLAMRIMKTIPFIVVSKSVKYLGIKLII